MMLQAATTTDSNSCPHGVWNCARTRESGSQTANRSLAYHRKPGSCRRRCWIVGPKTIVQLYVNYQILKCSYISILISGLENIFIIDNVQIKVENIKTIFRTASCQLMGKQVLVKASTNILMIEPGTVRECAWSVKILRGKIVICHGYFYIQNV